MDEAQNPPMFHTAAELDATEDPVESTEDSLIEQLDRRQNEVMEQLDLLDSQIDQLVSYWQNERGRWAA